METAFLPEKKKISYNTKIYTTLSIVLIVGTLLSLVFLNGLLASFDAVNQSETAPAKVSHWSGYVIGLDIQNKSEGVSSISGTWTVPQIAYSENNTYSSVWVGVGGYGEKTLIQAGTEQHCENGRISYFAWYELLPAAITTEDINLDIQPGDRVTTSITLVNEERGSWLITIVDETEGQIFQKTVDYPQSTRKTAEWIVERPTVNGQVSTLADFNQATLTDCTTTINGVTGSIKNFTYTKAVMIDSLQNDLVQTSNLGGDGASFTVTYLKPNQTITSPNA